MVTISLQQEKFEAMGTYVEICIAADKSLLSYAKKRIEDLEKKWSRFLPYSEITKLNNSNGNITKVSDDTFLILKRAYEGFKLTKGNFDPTVYGDILRAGYDKTFVDIKDASSNEVCVNSFKRGMDSIEFISENEVRFGINIGFDPGGIGKGLAADLVAQELIDRGAKAAMINIGGDLRVINRDLDSIVFEVDICDEHDETIETISLENGALCTSTTRKRKWSLNIAGETVIQNHIIGSTQNDENATNLASVISSQAWIGEALCKDLIINAKANKFELVESLNFSALIRSNDGSIKKSKNWNNYE